MRIKPCCGSSISATALCGSSPVEDQASVLQHCVAIGGMVYTPVSKFFTQELIDTVSNLITLSATPGKKTPCWEQIWNKLVSARLAYVSQVPPDMVGVHPLNRFKFGVGGTESMHHGADILDMGFSWKKCADVTAVEAPPAPKDEEAVAFNNSLVELSQGSIPKLKLMRLLSIGGGHTNTFLRQCLGGVVCIVKKYADSLGRLNADVLCVGRPELQEALEEGLKWNTLHWECPFVWPGLVPLAQDVLNTHARIEPSEVEGMLAMFHMAHTSLQNKSEPNWKNIQDTAVLSLPSWSSYAHVLAAYVQKNCGGKEGGLLEELSKFQKAFGCPEVNHHRVLGSEFLARVANMSFGGGERYPYVQNALIETNLSSPTTKVVDGRCMLISPTAVGSLQSKDKRKLMQEAEAAMVGGRALAAQLHFEGDRRVKVIGKLDVRCIQHITKTSQAGEGRVYADIGEVVQVY